MGFPPHGPESDPALWLNSGVNDPETATLIERYILGDKGFEVAGEGLLIGPPENRG
jgi:hypothetical protein